MDATRTHSPSACRIIVQTLIWVLSAGVGLAMIAASTGCGRGDPRNPDEARARGDALLRQMSDTLAKAQSFTFDAAETHERVRRNGQKVKIAFTRKVTVKRPDRLAFHQMGSEHDFNVWYDGRSLTVVGNRQHIFARANMPATLDAMFDRVAERYDVPLPMADLLYSSAYDALVGDGTLGGWVRRGEIDGRACEQLTYRHPVVDFTIDVSSSPPTLPCRLAITDKQRPGQPISTITFANWHLSVPVQESLFSAVIPADFEEIPIVERIPRAELSKRGPAPVERPAPR